MRVSKWTSCGTLRIWLALAVMLLLGSGCRTVPFTGRTQLMLTTSDYENSLGVSAYGEYKEKYLRSTNQMYNQALARVGDALKRVAEQDDFDWEFTVLASDTQNAFCLPGGKVAVFSGIMDIMENEAELACVVGHEIAHALARHGGERMSWGYLQTFGMLGLSIYDADVATIFGLGSELGVMLPFSRQNESEADYIGLILMAKAGYHPEAAVRFWQRFGKSSSGVSTFFSTHPSGDTRVEDLQSKLPEAMRLYQQAPSQMGLGQDFGHRQ